MRQSADLQYASLLKRARVGDLNSHDIASLLSRLSYDKNEVMAKTILHVFPLKADVHMHNLQHLALLKTTKYVLKSVHFFSRVTVRLVLMYHCPIFQVMIVMQGVLLSHWSCVLVLEPCFCVILTHQ